MITIIASTIYLTAKRLVHEMMSWESPIRYVSFLGITQNEAISKAKIPNALHMKYFISSRD